MAAVPVQQAPPVVHGHGQVGQTDRIHLFKQFRPDVKPADSATLPPHVVANRAIFIEAARATRSEPSTQTSAVLATRKVSAGVLQSVASVLFV